MAYWFLSAGFVLLLLGSEAAARGGVWLARAFGISPLAIGLAVLAPLTACPALFVAIRASARAEPDLALGAVLGGLLCALLFALGLGALLRPMSAPPKVIFRDGGAALLALLALIIFAQTGAITRLDGAILLAGFALYLALCFFTDWRRSPDHSVALASALARSKSEPPPAFAGLFLLALGLIALALGAHFAVLGLEPLAVALHLGEALAGLTILAAAVALPKLANVLIAALLGKTTLAVGQMLAGAVYELLAALGIVALLRPLTLSPAIATFGVYPLAGALALLLPLLAMRWRLTRPRAVLLLLVYLGYLAVLAWHQGWLPPHGLG